MPYDRNAPRPHLRKYPDPIDNKLFLDCMRARAQAWYQGQEWLLTDDEYIALWRQDDLYKFKGRHNEDYCLVRNDYSLPWQMDNVRIITRLEHYQICAREKLGKFASGLDRRRNKEKKNARQR